MRWHHGLLMALVGASALACVAPAEVDSTSLRTSGMYADFVLIDQNGQRTEVSVDLQAGEGGSATVVNLRGDDELVATSDGDSKQLSGRSGTYTVTFPGNHEGEEFTLAFVRGADDQSTVSTATLPLGFSLDGPPTISRSGAATVTWSPSGTRDDMSWHIEGRCLQPRSGEMGDPGELEVTGSNHGARAGHEQATCAAKLTVERRRRGMLDPAFLGGSVVAIQRRSIEFESTP